MTDWLPDDHLVYSSRRIAKATLEDVAFRLLTGDSQPHFTSINEFRRVFREHFSYLFIEALRLCERAGLVKLGHVALDGSKVEASASKHKAMSYKRLKEARESLEREAREQRAKELREQADGLEKSADNEEREVVEKRLKGNARARRKKAAAIFPEPEESPETPATELPKRSVETTPDGTPTDKCQRTTSRTHKATS